MGGVNTVLLAHGTTQEVKADCKRYLDEGTHGGGYIMAAGNMLPTETDPENKNIMKRRSG